MKKIEYEFKIIEHRLFEKPMVYILMAKITRKRLFGNDIAYLFCTEDGYYDYSKKHAYKTESIEKIEKFKNWMQEIVKEKK